MSDNLCSYNIDNFSYFIVFWNFYRLYTVEIKKIKMYYPFINL